MPICTVGRAAPAQQPARQQVTEGTRTCRTGADAADSSKTQKGMLEGREQQKAFLYSLGFLQKRRTGFLKEKGEDKKSEGDSRLLFCKVSPASFLYKTLID